MINDLTRQKLHIISDPDIVTNVDQAFYLSNQRIRPGFLYDTQDFRDTLGTEVKPFILYPRFGTNLRVPNIFTNTISGLTNVFEFNPVLGGMIDKMTTSGYQIVNGDGPGRHVSMAMFLNESGDTHNPTEGGGNYGDRAGASGSVHDVGADLMHGAPMTSFGSETFEFGPLITYEGIPLEWDVDGLGAETGTDHDGSIHQPISYPKVRFGSKIWMNWKGRKTAHKVARTFNTGEDVTLTVDVLVGFTYALRYAFEESYAYDVPTGTPFLLTDVTVPDFPAEKYEHTPTGACLFNGKHTRLHDDTGTGTGDLALPVVTTKGVALMIKATGASAYSGSLRTAFGEADVGFAIYRRNIGESSDWIGDISFLVSRVGSTGPPDDPAEDDFETLIPDLITEISDSIPDGNHTIEFFFLHGLWNDVKTDIDWLYANGY